MDIYMAKERKTDGDISRRIFSEEDIDDLMDTTRILRFF